jgi:hypothetical protein
MTDFLAGFLASVAGLATNLVFILALWAAPIRLSDD